jgi:hypothetical protein
MKMHMAVIEVSGHIEGTSQAAAVAGLRMTASAACHGLSAAAQPQRAPQQPAPKAPQGR